MVGAEAAASSELLLQILKMRQGEISGKGGEERRELRCAHGGEAGHAVLVGCAGWRTGE